MATDNGATEAQRTQRTAPVDLVAATDPLTEQIIGCAIEVHRHLGPGLLESTYEEALCLELAACGLRFTRQTAVPIASKGHAIGDYRLDLLVGDAVVVEVKSVERFHLPGAGPDLPARDWSPNGSSHQLQFATPQGRREEVRPVSSLRALCVSVASFVVRGSSHA